VHVTGFLQGAVFSFSPAYSSKSDFDIDFNLTCSDIAQISYYYLNVHIICKIKSQTLKKINRSISQRVCEN
jgi:hypothetical protein